ncbi:hypothetical protein PAMP_000054 [Pampus punctatissimus]
MAGTGEVVTMQEEEQSERKEEEIQNKNPWPNLEELFVFKRQQGNNVIMKCKMCLPSKTELSAYKTSTSNLRKHVVMADAEVEQGAGSRQHSSDEEDYFSAMKSRK